MATWRDEQGSKGERFYYSTTNQLSNVRYNADHVSTGNPVNWDRWVDYGYTPDRLNRWYVNDNGNFAWMGANALNQYTSLGGAALGYDERFNLRLHGGYQYDYDAANRLVSAAGNGQSAGFVYDGLGRCLKRTVNGAVTVIAYDGWKPTVELAGDGSSYAYNVHGAGPDEILWRYDSRPGYGHLRYHHDRHGNVTSLLNEHGSIIEKYSYDAFGTPKVTDPYGNDRKIGGRSASWYANRFLFQGREWIHELGIFDYRHRMYHPGLGRFLQTDPLGLQTEGAKLSAGQKALFSPGGVAPEAFASSEMNLYRYCGDDPVHRSDPTGLYLESAWDVLNIGLGVVSLASNVRQGNWGSAIVDGVGIIVDGAATAIPIIPGGAGAAIKAVRAADEGAVAIGKMKDLAKPTGWKPGDRVLNLPDKGSPRKIGSKTQVAFAKQKVRVSESRTLQLTQTVNCETTPASPEPSAICSKIGDVCTMKRLANGNAISREHR